MQENQSPEPQTVLQYLEAIKKQNQKQIELLAEIKSAAVFFHILGIIGLVASIIYAIILTN